MLLQFGEKNPGMTRVMVGDALVFENERLQARMNQFFDRIESQLRQSLRAPAEAAGSATPTVDANAQASALTAFAIGRLQRFARSGFRKSPTEHLDVALRLFVALSAGASHDDDPGRRPAARPCCPRRRPSSPPAGTLLVADAHIGKAVSFRALGVPVPRGTTSETLAGLTALVRRTGARRIVFLGDFLHSARGRTRRRTLAARGRAGATRTPALELVLVRGNHDDRAGDPPAALRHRRRRRAVRCWTAWPCATTRGRSPARYVLAGHLHPCVHVGGRALRPPAPALLLVRRRGRRAAGVRRLHRHAPGPSGRPSDRVFAVADDLVAAMPAASERVAA